MGSEREWPGLKARTYFIEIILEAHKDPVNFFRAAQVRDGIGDGIDILEAKQRRELLRVQFVDPDVVRQHEVEEGLLLVAEVSANRNLGARVARSSRVRAGRA
jgi:hypothetical protein